MKKILLLSLILNCQFLIVNSFAQSNDCSPALFKDLRPGYSDSYPENFRVTNDQLFFSNYDGLWKSDGTEAGTIQIVTSAYITDIEVLNNILYYCVSNPVRQLWKTDGSAAGTALIKEFPTTNSYPSIDNLTSANGLMFFSLEENYVSKLWRSDGTQAGTFLVKDIDPTNYLGNEPVGLFEFNNNLYFRAGNTANGKELWKSDGTEMGTAIVKDIYLGAGSGHGTPVYAILNNELYFYANDASQYGLWKTNGTDAGTFFVKECVFIDEMATINNAIYFSAYDIGANQGQTLYGEEVWISDGTSSGTHLLKDIYPGPDGSGVNAYQFKAVNNNVVVFSAQEGTNGVELWSTNGTEGGTALLKDINPGVNSGGIGLSTAKIFNGYLYFSASDGTTGAEPWKTDGTAGGTSLVSDAVAGSESSAPYEFTNFNGNLFFKGVSPSSGVELWSCGAVSAIGEITLERISLFPNPTIGQFTLEFPTTGHYEIEVFNTIGQVVYRSTATNATKHTINIGNAPVGMYNVRVRNEKNSLSKVLIVD